MKKIFLVLILIIINISLHATFAFMGLYYGKANFDNEKMQTRFGNADNANIRLHFLFKENHWLGLSLNAGGITDDTYVEADNTNYKITQTTLGVQYTPHYYYSFTKEMGIYFFGGLGLGTIATNFSSGLSADQVPEENLDSALSYSWSMGTKLELKHFAIDALYQQTWCKDDGIQTGNNTLFFGISTDWIEYLTSSNEEEENQHNN